MSNKLPAPENYVIIPGDKSGMSSWSAVEGAAGYIIEYYKTEAPDERVLKIYTQQLRKNVLGLTNGVEYFSTICAFHYVDGLEILGHKTPKFYFVPIANSFIAQRHIVLDVDESAYIEWEYKNTIPPVTIHSNDTSILAACDDGEITAYGKGETTVSLTRDDTGETIDVDVIIGRDNKRSHVKHTTLLFTGDIHSGFRAQRTLEDYSYDFYELFSQEIKDILHDSDYTAGTLVTMCDDRSAYTYEEPRLALSTNMNSPSTFVDAISDSGFNCLFTATNHNMDAGLNGLTRTRKTILKAGMNHVGSLGDNPIIRKINGLRIAFINLSQLGSSMDSSVDNKNITLGRYSDSYAEELINTARIKKADFIVVMMHWGVENSSVVTSKQRMTAQSLAEFGADVIIGSGTNTLQAYEEISTSDGRLVPCIYSLGCFYTEMRELHENTFSSIAKVTINEDSSSYSCRMTLIPTVGINRNGNVTVIPINPIVTEVQQKAYDSLHKFYPAILFDEALHTNILIQGSLMLDELVDRIPYLYDYTTIDIEHLTVQPFDYLLFDISPFVVLPNPEEELLQYLDAVSQVFPSERIILLRMNIPSLGVHEDKIVECDDLSEVNHTLYELEDLAISTVHPIVIDVSEYYLLDLDAQSDVKVFETYFYKHCLIILDQIISGGKSKFYYNEQIPSIWLERALLYHDSLLESSFKRQMFGYTEAADLIIENSSKIFLELYVPQLLKLKELHAELKFAKAIIGDDFELIPLVRRVDKLIEEMEDNW